MKHMHINININEMYHTIIHGTSTQDHNNWNTNCRLGWSWWNSWNWWSKSNITYNDDNSRCHRLLYIWNAVRWIIFIWKIIRPSWLKRSPHLEGNLAHEDNCDNMPEAYRIISKYDCWTRSNSSRNPPYWLVSICRTTSSHDFNSIQTKIEDSYSWKRSQGLRWWCARAWPRTCLSLAFVDIGDIQSLYPQCLRPQVKDMSTAR